MCDFELAMMERKFALVMERKSEVVRRCFELHPNVYPSGQSDSHYVICDFELALIRPVQRIFVEGRLSGCHFVLSRLFWCFPIA